MSATTSENGRLFARPASMLLIRRSISSSHAASTSASPVASLLSRSVRASLSCSSCRNFKASCVISANFELTASVYRHRKRCRGWPFSQQTPWLAGSAASSRYGPRPTSGSSTPPSPRPREFALSCLNLSRSGSSRLSPRNGFSSVCVRASRASALLKR